MSILYPSVRDEVSGETETIVSFLIQKRISGNKNFLHKNILN